VSVSGKKARAYVRWFILQHTNHFCSQAIYHIYTICLKQDAQLSQRDRAALCDIVFVKSTTLELGDNDLRTL